MMHPCTATVLINEVFGRVDRQVLRIARPFPVVEIDPSPLTRSDDSRCQVRCSPRRYFRQYISNYPIISIGYAKDEAQGLRTTKI